METKKVRPSVVGLKKFLVSFLVLVSILFLAASVSALPDVTSGAYVEIDGVDVLEHPAIVAGETILIKVQFESDVNASDIIIRAELEGERKSVDALTAPFDVEDNHTYSKTLKLEVPFDLKDTLSGFVDLDIRISGGGYRTDLVDPSTNETIQLRVQRESYNVNVLSVSVPQITNAGESFPIDFVLRNIGYNDLNDLFVTMRISALEIERSVFLGDLVALECDDDASSVDNYGIDIVRKCFEDKTDTANGRIFLQLPYDANPGVYALELKIENEDMAASKTVQLVVKNAFSAGNFIVSGNQLLIVNPTNELVVYRLVPQSTGIVTVSVSESVVAVPAGSSKTVTVDATSTATGTQTYNVSVFSADGTLVDTVSFSETFGGKGITSPVAVLTVVLAIIFIVLLVVLIVLVGKKPKKAEEFGESYY